MNNKQQHIDIYEYLNAGNEIIPTFELSNLQYNDGNRYLTSHEMRQVQNHQTITTVGLSSSQIDINVAQQAIKQMGDIYKFLTSSITKTNDGKWFRYQLNSEKVLQLTINQSNIITNIETQFKDYDTITLNNLFTAELYQAEIKYGGNQKPINCIITMQVHHCLMDAQNLIFLMRQFNTFYNQLLKNEVIQTDFVQLAPFRPVNALMNKINVKQIAEKLMADEQAAKINIGKITNKSTSHKQNDMVNNILYEAQCTLKDYKLEQYNLTSAIYAAVALSFYQKALTEQTTNIEDSLLIILADIKNIRQILQQYEGFLADERIAGSFFIPNFIPVKIGGSDTLQSILDSVYQQQSAEISQQKLIGTIIKCDYNKLQRESSLQVNIMVSNLGKINLGPQTPVQDVITLSTEIVKEGVHNGIALLVNQCSDRVVISEDDLGYFSIDEQHHICANIINILKIMKQSEKELSTIKVVEIINQLNKD